jgi:hypothetical protein
LDVRLFLADEAMTLRRPFRAHRVLVVLTLIACGTSPTESSRWATVTVNASEYTATRIHPESVIPFHRVTVVTSIRNTGPGPLYLAQCGSAPPPVYGVELVRPNHPEGSAFDGAWGCPGGSPIVLAAGAVRTDTLTLHAPSGVQNGRALGVVEGTKRIVFNASTCYTEAECATGGARELRLASSPFDIRLP